MEKLSFIHAADLHLDSPFQRLASVPETIFKQIQSSTFHALNNLVKTAIAKEVDFVLLVGDLFDNERQSLKAQIKLKKAFEELANHNINVYVSYGNHDFINGNPYPISYPDNVYIFNEEAVHHFTYEKNGKSAANIYGFSYENRAVKKSKTEEFRVVDRDIPFHLAMLHGSLFSNTEHDTYAPFYLQDLIEKDFDYWALGHIHQRSILKQRPAVVYPGNIQGRNRKESGSKGCYHVTLTKENVNLSFVPLQTIEFNTLHVDVSNCNEPHMVEEIIKQSVFEQDYNVPQLLSLVISGSNSSISDWEKDGLIEEIIDLLNESEQLKNRWDFIFRYELNVQQAHDEMLLKKGKHFIGELLRRSEDAPIHIYTEELFRHKQARKYVDKFTKNEEEHIKNKAKQLLVDELLKGGS